MIYTNNKLFMALRDIIPNLPPEGIGRLELVLEGAGVPTMKLQMWPVTPPAIGTAPEMPVTKRFYLIEDKNWDLARKCMAFSELELEKMS